MSIVRLRYQQGVVLARLAEVTGYTDDELAGYMVEVGLRVLMALRWEDRRRAVLDEIERDYPALVDIFGREWNRAAYGVRHD